MADKYQRGAKIYRTLGIEAARLKAKAIDPKAPDDPGWIEGYLAVFGNVDCQGERIIRGAFAKTIQERIPAGKVYLMTRHIAYGGDTKDAVGIITEAREDDYGLWIHAKLFSTDDAQELRAKINQGMKPGLSVGYRVFQYSMSKEGAAQETVINLEELGLEEGTVTLNPANEKAGVTAAKNNGSFEERLNALEQIVAKRADPSAPENTGDAPHDDGAASEAALCACEQDLRHNQLILERIKAL